MNALSHATSSIFSNNLRAPYTPGLQGRPPISLIGARTSYFDRLSSFVNAGPGSMLAGSVRVLK
jgi:hypothetical protein